MYQNPFIHRNVPFSFNGLNKLPEKYRTYLPLLTDRVAIIEDCIYSDNTTVVDCMKKTIDLVVTSQSDRKPREVSYRPLSLAYGAALIIQNGEMIKNRLQ